MTGRGRQLADMMERKNVLVDISCLQEAKWIGSKARNTKYFKQDFLKIIFTDKCKLSLDDSDSWSKGWIVDGQDVSLRLRRHQRGGVVMCCVAIVGNTSVEPFKVKNRVRMNSQS